MSIGISRTAVRPGAHHEIVAPRGAQLLDYASAHKALIGERLEQDGAVLLRGFGAVGEASFEAVVRLFVAELMAENGEHVPLADSASLYTPVPYAADQKLLWHNENSFNDAWPAVIAFCAVQPAVWGGETTLADSRAMLDALAPEIVEAFMARDVAYVRTMGLGVGRSWQQVLRTEDRREAEDKCRRDGCSFAWLDDDVLQTRCVRPATLRHQRTGQLSWFNQAQHWHNYFLDKELREELLDMFGSDSMPRDCTFGDGSAIDDGMMEQIAQAYQALEWPVAWRQGDVLLVDNVALAHARNPYRGPRKMLVAMGR